MHIRIQYVKRVTSKKLATIEFFTNYQETKEHYPDEEVTYANCMREIAADYKGLFGDEQKELPIEIKVSLVDNSLYL